MREIGPAGGCEEGKLLMTNRNVTRQVVQPSMASVFCGKRSTLGYDGT